MARRNRRGQDPDETPRDDELSAEDAAVEEEFADELDDADEFEDDLDSDTADAEREPAGGRGVATKQKARSSSADRKSTRGREPARANIFARIVNFFKEVVAELRKVIWPTRKELLTYTTVVVVFVVIMLSFVGLLDYGFARAVLWVFGDKSGGGSE